MLPRFPRILPTVLTLSLLSLPVGVSAQTIMDGYLDEREHFNALYFAACEGDAEALAELRTEALENNHPIALNNLGHFHRINTPCAGAEHDPQLMNDVTRAAAEQGYPIAIYNWGLQHLDGNVLVHQDIDTGIALYRQAAEAGYWRAAMQLAQIYGQGLHGTEVDLEEAEHWYALAVELGEEPANLARVRSVLDFAAGQ